MGWCSKAPVRQTLSKAANGFYGILTAQSDDSKAASPHLDWKPRLSLLQEGLCFGAAALVCSAFYALTAPATLNVLYAGFMALLCFSIMGALRYGLLEAMYRSRQLPERELGDPDSRFHQLQQLLVHAKCQDAAPSGQPPAWGVHCYHGFGSNTFSWSLVQAQLAQQLQGVVTAHDMPGFGLTARPADLEQYYLDYNGRLGLSVLRHELRNRSGASSGTRVVLVGHSMGGACAALAALERPHEVAALVLVAPAVFALPGQGRERGLLVHQRSRQLLPQQQQQQQAGRADSASSIDLPPPPSKHHHQQQQQQHQQAAASPQEHLFILQPYTTTPSPPPPPPRPPTRLQTLARAAASAAQALAAASVLASILLLKPLIVLILRLVVRSKSFWQRGLASAYHDPSKVSAAVVDAYRLPQLVRGWEEGMLQFVLARLAGISFLGQLLFGRRKGSEGAASGLVMIRDGVMMLRDAVAQGLTPAALGSAGDAMATAAAAAADPAGSLADQLAAVVERHGIPVLIVHGEGDRIVPVGNSKRLARRIPGCQLAVYTCCGHMPQEELPGGFVETVAGFLREVEQQQHQQQQ